MAANKKPRKKHKPMARVMPICFGVPDEARTDLALPPYLILDAFKRGQGDEEGAHTLAAAVNLTAVLARSADDEAKAIANAGLGAVWNVMHRGATGRWGMSGDDAKAIGEALSLMEALQAQGTRRSVRDAIAVVYREAAV